ncbi:MAG: cytochrome c [Phyllobacteriaceae bacterium]|nr:cytochrome c [Phyllobacteriaceae bacterium]
MSSVILRPSIVAALVFSISGMMTVGAAAQDAPATPPTQEQITAGKRVWVDAACANCHGNNGQGGNSKDFPKGPSMRTSALDYWTTREIIACGLPGTLMPAWAKGAYIDRECFGGTGEIPEGTRVIGVYDEQQLDDLMAYINATFRNGEME